MEIPYQKKGDNISSLCWGNKKNHVSDLFVSDDKGWVTQYEVMSSRVKLTIKATDTWINTIDVEPIDNRILACGTMNAKIMLYPINKDNKNKDR